MKCRVYGKLFFVLMKKNWLDCFGLRVETALLGWLCLYKSLLRNFQVLIFSVVAADELPVRFQEKDFWKMSVNVGEAQPSLTISHRREPICQPGGDWRQPFAGDTPPSHSPALSLGCRWSPGSSHRWQLRLLGWCTAARSSSCTGKGDGSTPTTGSKCQWKSATRPTLLHPLISFDSRQLEGKGVACGCMMESYGVVRCVKGAGVRPSWPCWGHGFSSLLKDKECFIFMSRHVGESIFLVP